MPWAGDSGYRIGLGEVKITPPVGTPMAGFGVRTGPAEGVHDDLSVRTILVAGGGKEVALVTCEVLETGKEIVDAIREKSEERTGIPARQILVCATHTHSGPVIEGDYRDFFIDSAVESILRACQSRRPGRIGCATIAHRGWIGFNRRALTRGFHPVDRQIQVLKICDADGSIRCVAMNYACHPACLGPHNRLFTADWPHFASEKIRSSLGLQIPILFFQGTEGNVNTGYSADLSAIGAALPNRNFLYAREAGENLADAVLAALPGIEVRSGGVIDLAQEIIRLKYYLPETLAAAARRLKRAQQRVQKLQDGGATSRQVDDARIRVTLAGCSLRRTRMNLQAGSEERAVEIQAVRIGDAGLVAFPGEFFVEIGLEVKRRSPFATTFCLGLANDNVGYVPTEDAFCEGGYEVSVARFSPASAPVWTETAVRLLEALSGRT